jgi:adenylate cyclase
MPAVVRDILNGEEHDLGEVVLLGRGEGAAIRLSDASVSRQHATIRFEDRHFWIADLGSANGTFVNGVAVKGARVLRHGDRLQLGNAVLVFEDGGQRSLPAWSGDDRTQIARRPTEPVKSMAATILVADLKGFTAICSVLAPADVAALLGEWYADCNAILRQHGGTVDSFIGDCVFAYWHGTEPDIRMKALHAAGTLRAVEAAPRSPTRILLGERHGLRLDCHVGIHVGAVAMGATGKGISTALGDAVNVAFRVEGLTRVLGRPVLASAAFLEGWPDGLRVFEPCGSHAVKGKDEPVEVFALAAWQP